MKVIIYDKKPGEGFSQWFLMLSWAFASKIQKLFNIVDEVYAAESWEDAKNWLTTRETKYFSSIQYWGHGSPGYVWLNSKPMNKDFFLCIKDKLDINSLIWFRICSLFRGQAGYNISKHLSNSLNCTIAGHTRTIGIIQSGLHTRKPMTEPSWSIEEGDIDSWISPVFYWSNNSIICLQTKIPNGW